MNYMYDMCVNLFGLFVNVVSGGAQDTVGVGDRMKCVTREMLYCRTLYSRVLYHS
jgi:hypothetical protein